MGGNLPVDCISKTPKRPRTSFTSEQLQVPACPWSFLFVIMPILIWLFFIDIKISKIIIEVMIIIINLSLIELAKMLYIHLQKSLVLASDICRLCRLSLFETRTLMHKPCRGWQMWLDWAEELYRYTKACLTYIHLHNNIDIGRCFHPQWLTAHSSIDLIMCDLSF